MFKNVAAKFMVFAFDATTNVPKTGDAANITAYVSKDYGTVTVLGDTSATEMDATNAPGYYLFDAAQGETNADCLMISGKSATSNIKIIGAPAVIYTRPTTGWLAPATAGRTLVVDAQGLADANVVKLGPTGSGTAQTAKDVGGAVPAVAAGASGGILISGSNSGTTTLGALTVTGATTLTGNVLLSDGLTVAAPSTTNRAGITITGNGTGEAIIGTGGATGNGMTLSAGATSGHGLSATATGTSFNGLNLVGSPTTGHGILTAGGSTSGSGIKVTSITGDAVLAAVTTSGHGISFTGKGAAKHGITALGGSTGSGIVGTGGNSGGDGIAGVGSVGGNGFLATGGTTGIGMTIAGGSSSGTGVQITTTSGDAMVIAGTVGNGINITANGTSKHGVLITGGTAGTSDGLKLVAGSGGVGLRAASATITGATTLTGAVSLGSTLGVTGTTTLATVATGTVTLDALTVTNNLLVSGNSTVTGTTTHTGAVSATNPSNDIRGVAFLSTADFTAAQKTSLNAATPASVQNITASGGIVSADVKKVNAVAVNGDGNATPWGP